MGIPSGYTENPQWPPKEHVYMCSSHSAGELLHVLHVSFLFMIRQFDENSSGSVA